MILIKLAFRAGADTISILFLRLMFALPFYLFILTYFQQSKQKFSASRSQWLSILFLSFMGFYISSFLDFYGLNYLPAGIERIIIFSTPVLVLMISFILFRTKITKAQIWSATICYLGIVITFFNTGVQTDSSNMLLGGALVLASAVTYSIYLIYSERLLHRIPMVYFTCTVMIFSTIFVAIHYIIMYDLSAILQLDHKIYLYGLIMAILCTVLPTFMMSEGLKRLGAGNTAIFGGIGPVSTILFAALILDEHFTLVQYLGSALVIYGVYILTKATKKQELT